MVVVYIGTYTCKFIFIPLFSREYSHLTLLDMQKQQPCLVWEKHLGDPWQISFMVSQKCSILWILLLQHIIVF